MRLAAPPPMFEPVRLAIVLRWSFWKLSSAKFGYKSKFQLNNKDEDTSQTKFLYLLQQYVKRKKIYDSYNDKEWFWW